MNKLLAACSTGMLLASLFSCGERQDTLPIEKTASVGFAQPNINLYENASEGIDVNVQLTVPASKAGSIDIQVIDGQPTHRIMTDPPLSENGKLTLPVAVGSTEVSFKVVPVDDHLFNGNQEATFQILALTGDLEKGSNLFATVLLIDNELSGSLRYFESDGMGFHRQSYEYSHLGNLNKIGWLSIRNLTTEGEYRYVYDDFGRIIRINGEPGNYRQIFSYENGKLKRNERLDSSGTLEVDEYNVEDDGILTGIQHYRRLPDGTTAMNAYTVFTYFSSGSVHTITTYAFEAPVTYAVTKKITYTDYLQKTNPLAHFQDIPGLLIQPLLPQKMIIEEHGTTFTYQFEYEFTDSDLVRQRRTRGPSGLETTNYFYY
ncbi:MAG: hypothetical protein JJU34_07540 [Lunatimonas sp.]|uniref:hypothetical protein n=1 Tax=Lunatimonas sp. TaxID=2060141 RepID=UPI00263B390D|nr:hypothetical protein [Lunatimonas sp.]MCC5937118.1 hypothetical protein [Lunatimonas sp.]